MWRGLLTGIRGWLRLRVVAGHSGQVLLPGVGNLGRALLQVVLPLLNHHRLLHRALHLRRVQRLRMCLQLLLRTTKSIPSCTASGPKQWRWFWLPE